MWTTTLALALLGAAAGQESTETKAALPADDVHEAFVELEDAYDDARSEYFAGVQAAYEVFQASDDQSGGFTMPDAIEPDWYPRFADLAIAGSVDANVWCIQHHDASSLEGADARLDKSERYVEVFSEELQDGTLTTLVYALMGDARSELGDPPSGDGIGRVAAFRFLDVIDKMAEGDEIRATTLYARGQSLIPYKVSGDKAKAGMVYYRRAAAEYPKTEMGQRCSGMVFAEDNLKIGQMAPDIVGKDHDGNALKLSDFEGKVTVIDFWGFW